jgi:hypothetical protein
LRNRKSKQHTHKEVATAAAAAHSLIMHFLCTTAAKINLICASDECLMRPRRRFVLQRKNILHYQLLLLLLLRPCTVGVRSSYIIILNVSWWVEVRGLRVMHYLWRLFCVLLPRFSFEAAQGHFSRRAALMKILLTCFLFAPRRRLCFLTLAEQKLECQICIRQRQQLTSFLFFPPDFSLSLYICILLKILKNKLHFSSGAGWKEFEFFKQLVS